MLFWVGYEIGRFFGWPLLDSIFLGAMLSMSSTTVIIKVLGELGKMKERFAQLIFGILIIEDILGIAMIALLSGIAMTGKLSVGDVGMTLGKLGIFLAVTLVAGLLAVPRLIGYVGRFKSNEMLIVTVLGLCFGVSLLAAKLGYSVALGAFVIGAVIAEAREIHRVEALLEPVRDMFSAIFFVAIGLLIDPKMLITLLAARRGHHAGRDRGEGVDLLLRSICRRQRHPDFPARRHGPGADRGILLHHRVAGRDAQGHERFSLSYRGGGFRHYHPADAVSDQERGWRGGLV